MSKLSVRLNSNTDDLTFAQLQRLVTEAKAAGAITSSKVIARTCEVEVVIDNEAT